MREAVATAFAAFGPGEGTLYLAQQALERMAPGRCSLRRLWLVAVAAQTIPAAPAAAAAVEVRTLSAAEAEAAGVVAPPALAAARRSRDVACLAAFKSGALAGWRWLAPLPYADEEVCCRFAAVPGVRAAWGFDFYVRPEHRIGLAFARLWAATGERLRRDGHTHVLSYVSVFQPRVLAAERRLGARVLGRASFLRLGPLQLMRATLPPFAHLSLGGSVPTLPLDPRAAGA